ncbi:peroxiredoxin-like family protein [Leptolyngbyaceae cyanobacterium UHCC 1019]
MLTSTDFSGLLSDRFFKNFLPIPASNDLNTGMLTPDFVLPNVTHDQEIQLSSFRQQKPIILAFTRIFTENQYCPFCFPHIKALNDRYQEFCDRNIELLMITSTDLHQSKIVAQDLGLKMPLLSNPGCQVFQEYHTGQALGAPLPAQFVLDQQGRLHYKHLFSFLDHNASVDTLLQVAKKTVKQ